MRCSRGKCDTVPAIVRQPVKRTDQLRGEGNALRIDPGTVLKDLASAAVQVQIAAGGGGIDYPSPLILNLFETTATALTAKSIPRFFIKHMVCHECTITSRQQAVNSGYKTSASAGNRKNANSFHHTSDINKHFKRFHVRLATVRVIPVYICG